MAQSVSNHFHAALTYLLDQEGRGAQSRLASQQNIDRGYLNAIVKGRKPGSEEVRAKVASHFNLPYEDMLALGRRILGRDEDVLSVSKKGSEQETATRNDIARTEQGVGDFKSPGKPEEIQFDLSGKIMKVVEILESNTTYSDVLAELIDAFHEAINMKKDNLALRNQMKAMESRIASLEKMLAYEKECAQKSA